MGLEDQEARVSLAVGRLAEVRGLALRGETVHVQPQRRQPDDVECEAVLETGQHNIPTR